MGYITINPTVLAGTEHFLGADLISVFNSSGCHLSITSGLESNLRHYCYAQVARDVRATDDGDDVDGYITHIHREKGDDLSNAWSRLKNTGFR